MSQAARTLRLIALLLAAPAFALAGETPSTLTASSVPLIVTQPQSAVVNGGQSASFSVVANAADVSYAWQRNAVNIIGATSDTYVVPAAALADSGANFTVLVTNAMGSATSTVARLTVNSVAAQQASASRPYSDQSPWNARASKFTLGTYQIPTSSYYPTIEEGAYSTGAFAASASDPQVTVKGNSDDSGIWVPDAEANLPQVVIPHWPAGVVPAPGSDGHADIIDPSTNRVHSFYQLNQVDGQWRASQYTWTALDGRGFGTPAQYQQGSRAAGVPASAGLIRKSEVDDGQPI